MGGAGWHPLLKLDANDENHNATSWCGLRSAVTDQIANAEESFSRRSASAWETRSFCARSKSLNVVASSSGRLREL